MMGYQQPGGPTPEQRKQIEANVASIRAQIAAGKATEKDVDDYLALEQQRFGVASAPADATSVAPAQPPESIWRGMARAAGQGATLGFGDEIAQAAGLPQSMQPDMQKQAAFEKNHSVLNFLAKLGGGAIAPVVATLAAPELATLTGAAALGATAGMINGAGEGTDMESRAKGAIIGADLGLAGGVVGAGAGKLLGKAATGMKNLVNPTSKIAGEATHLIEPRTAAQMQYINRLAPGGASVANSTVPEAGKDVMSRMTGLVKTVGSDAGEAAGAEGQIMSSHKALQGSLDKIGAKIQANEKVVPITKQVRSAVAQARDVIGRYAPNLGPDQPQFANPLGLDVVEPVTLGGNTSKNITTTELHDMLSRIRYAIRKAQAQGTDAPGQTLHDLGQAADAVKEVLYGASPKIAKIDKAYAAVADHLRTNELLLENVQSVRSAAPGTRVMGNEPITPGHSFSKAKTITSLVKGVFVDPAKGPAAVRRLLLQPGGRDMVARLIAKAPNSKPVAAAVGSALGQQGLPRLESMFSSQPQSPQDEQY